MTRAVAPPLEHAADWEAELASIRLYFGPGRVRELGAVARGLEATNVLLVSDAGLREAGHLEAAERVLREAGLKVSIFDGVESNPTTRHVEAGAELARGGGFDLIAALGGGSSLDCAKGINFVLTNGGRMEHYWGFGKATQPMLPAVAVPTTAGTGSEAQSYALISQVASGRKMACGDPKARFRAVILDPELLASAPKTVVAESSMDALSHAVESHVTRRRNPVSAVLARGAWRQIGTAVETILDGTAGVEERGSMLVGAHFAGAAIEASMLGAAHAAANPLTARYRIPHGEAVGLMLPHVVRFNGETVGALYRDLAPGGASKLADRIEALRRAAGLAERLRDRGVEEEALPRLAGLAVDEWTGAFNPRPAGEREFLELYEAAF